MKSILLKLFLRDLGRKYYVWNLNRFRLGEIHTMEIEWYWRWYGKWYWGYEPKIKWWYHLYFGPGCIAWRFN